MEITASERVHGKFQKANINFRGLGYLWEEYTFPRTTGRETLISQKSEAVTSTPVYDWELWTPRESFPALAHSPGQASSEGTEQATSKTQELNSLVGVAVGVTLQQMFKA